MQTVYSMTQTRRDFELLVVRVNQGETFTITRYGKPVARLEPLTTSDSEFRVATEKNG